MSIAEGYRLRHRHRPGHGTRAGEVEGEGIAQAPSEERQAMIGEAVSPEPRHPEGRHRMHDVFVKACVAYMSLARAALAAGVCEKTLRRWRKRFPDAWLEVLAL